jgi:hypothetical protein
MENDVLFMLLNWDISGFLAASMLYLCLFHEMEKYVTENKGMTELNKGWFKFLISGTVKPV